MKSSERIQAIKKSHPFKVWDLCVYAFVAAAALLLLIAASEPKGDGVRITYYDAQGTRITEAYPLDAEREIEIEAPDGGHCTVKIKDGKVWVAASDCRDKICMETGKISRANQQIICLPYRIIITITGESVPDEVDV